jgi:acyl carrier protein
MSTHTSDSPAGALERVIGLLCEQFGEQTRGRRLDAKTHLREDLYLSSMDLLAVVAHVELLVGEAPSVQDLATVGALADFVAAREV